MHYRSQLFSRTQCVLLSTLGVLYFAAPMVLGQAPDILPSDPHTLSIDRSQPVLSTRLMDVIQSAREDTVIPIWVFLTDKGIFDETEYQQELSKARARLVPAAHQRRLKARGSGDIVDFRDIPVRSEYLQEILSTGVELRHTLKWFNAITVNASPSDIEKLARLSFVRHIKSVLFSTTNIDIDLTPLPPDLTLVSLDYGPSYAQLEQINVIAAHELGFKGQGVIVCMMDTGYRQGHEAFQNIIGSGRLIAQYDFINGDDNTDYDPDQDLGWQPDHGTMTWSTLGGESEGNLYGPAYLASFVLSKSEDISSERHIEEDNWAAGAEWAESMGASVISASLGYRWFDSGEGDYGYEDLDGNSTIVTIAADLAAYNGIAVATAQGNNGSLGPGSLLAPADGDSVIACGAVNVEGELAGFSALGPTYDGRTKPEVCAQGVQTVCVDPYNNTGYTTASGTSLSTPLIGGVCAVLFSAHPNWTLMMVREALMMTADRFDVPDNAYGWGIVDVGRALYYNPGGDILFQHSPVLISGENQAIPISVAVTGGTDIQSVYLYYRLGENGEFSEILLDSPNGQDFSGEIPGLSGDVVQYYLKADDVDGSFAFHPIGGEMHPVTVDLNGMAIFDSFEDGPQLWRSGGINNFWGISTRYVNSGHLSITDSPTTLYREDTDSWIETAFKLDLSGASNAELSFYYRSDLQIGHDTLFVEASSDGGNNWNRFSQSITGESGSFVQYSADLAEYIGQPDLKLRFHFVSDEAGSDDGIYIDEVLISWEAYEVIPTLSEWGMIILALLLLAVGTIAVIHDGKRIKATTNYQVTS